MTTETPRVIPICKICDTDGPPVTMLMFLHGGGGECCGQPRGLEPADDPNYDPTPWCSGCGAMKKSNCHCSPIAENE
jgi:hypothetical protein